MNRIQYLIVIILLLFIKTLSFYYLSMELIEADDCIIKINTTKNGNELIYLDFYNYSTNCKRNNYSYYPYKNDSLLINELYDFGEIIHLTAYDKNIGNGYINITVKINEYIIKCQDQKFWKCFNCYGANNNYIYNENGFAFYRFGNVMTRHIYYFDFQINSLSELNYEGIEIDYNYLALTNQKIFNHSIYYKNNELELINFNTTDNFYIKKNRSLNVDYNNYYFKIYFDEEIPGTLIGLDLLNYSEIRLDNGSSFKVNETNGLKYILSSQEKNKTNNSLKIYMIAYNNPNNNNSSKKVTNKEEFIFNIILYQKFECLNEEIVNYTGSIEQINYSCPLLKKEELNDIIPEILDKIEIGKEYNIIGNDIIINISPNNSRFLNSYIDLNLVKCEKIIKEYYNIPSSNIITFIHIKKTNNNLSSFDNETEYMIIDNNKTFLNLSICNEKNKNEDIIISDTIPSNDNKLLNNTQIIIYLNQTKEELMKNVTKLIENIEIEKTYEMKGEDFTVKISPTNATTLSNSTHVNFTKCENILRNHYNISSSRYISFLQLEIFNKDSQVLINKLEYQAYDDNKNLLNLSLCDENIKIIHSIKSSSLFDDIQASLFQDLGIDIFNINDSFFTDVCHSYSDSENDLTLKDRIKNIFQNYSLCEEGCSYDEIDIGNLTITCDCKVKTNISMEEIKVNLYKYEEKSANFHIIKCYDLVFSFKDKFNNIGFWIFLVLILLHIPLLILFLCQGIKPIRDYINKEMVKYGYINEKEATHLVDNENYVKKSNNSKKFNKIKRKNSRKNNKRKKNNGQNSSPPKKNNKKKTAKNIIYQRKNNQTNNNNANIKNKNFKNKKQKLKQSSKNNSLNTKSIINNLIDSKIINILPTQERKKKRKNKIFKKNKKQKIQVMNMKLIILL